MRIYKCIFSGAEVFCDNDRPLVLVDDVVYELTGRMVEVGGEDFGLAGNVDEDAEEGATAEAGAEAKQKVVDIVYNYQLTETAYDKKSYMAYIKGYMKALNDTIKESKGEEASAKFMAGAQTFVKKVLADFGEYQFFLPNAGDEADYEKATLILCKWEGETPKFWVFADGLKGERV